MLKDQATISHREITPEGYLKSIATVTCVGVQDYLGAELTKAFCGEMILIPTKTYKVFRPKETVFHDETIESAKLQPITDGHPPIAVNSTNNKEISFGNLGEQSFKLNNETELGFNFVITDENCIAKINDGRSKLSLGYNGKIIVKKGNYKGEDYDMIFDGPMIVNHLALVTGGRTGRCGDGAKILDEICDNKKEVKMIKKKHLIQDDLDMGTVISVVADKILPDIQAMIKGEDFVNKLAEVVAGNLTAVAKVPDAVDAVDAVDEENSEIPGENKKTEEILDQDIVENNTDNGNDTDILPLEPEIIPEEVIATDECSPIQDSVIKRISLINKVKRVRPNIVIGKKTNLVLLQDTMATVLGANKVKGLSEDYLHAHLDIELNNRQKARGYLNDSSGMNNSNISLPKNGLALRNMMKKINREV